MSEKLTVEEWVELNSKLRKRNVVRPYQPLHNYIPIAYTFSELSTETDEGERPFEISDNGAQANEMLEQQYGTYLLIDILSNLDDREKIIFLYQMIREFGYAVDHGTLAKTLKIHRVTYMDKLKLLREKLEIISFDYKQRSKK